MQRLGYGDRFAAQGGDWGGGITELIGTKKAAGCIGVHINAISFEPTPDEVATADDKELQAIERMNGYQSRLSGYFKEQSTRPQTIGYGLADSPVAQASWIYEKFNDWTDNAGDPESILSMDEMLDNIMLYWLNNAGASSARRYCDHTVDSSRGALVEIPSAFSLFPKDIEGPARRWAQRRYTNIVRWSEAARGGHFAALEQPVIFIEELRAAMRAISAT